MLELAYLPNSDFGWNAISVSLYVNGTTSIFLFLLLVCWWNVVRGSSEAAEDA
jgi:hypothetical protein